MSRAGALVAGAATFALVAAACALAWRDESPLVPSGGGTVGGARRGSSSRSWSAAFAAYLAGLAWMRRAGLPLAAAALVAVAIQLVPLAAPLLLSTDAWTYWSYGWIAARSGGNPYVDAPQDVPGNPALPYMGADWLDTTSVYGPAFTLLSEPVALAAGSSADAAAWAYKSLAGVAVVAAALLAGRVSRRRSLAVAFVGWNPRAGRPSRRRRPQRRLLGALLMAALALSASRRLQAAGATWALAVLLKWVPLLFLGLRASRRGRRGGATAHRGFALTFAAVLALATWRYGLHWAEAVVPLAGNAALETSYAIPHRLEQLGVPDGVALALAAPRSSRRRRMARRRGTTRSCPPRPRGVPRARHDPVSRGLVPRLGGAARRRRRRRRRRGWQRSR